MAKSIYERKIALFLCKKYECWIKPESCIKRQSGEINYQKEDKYATRAAVFDLKYCTTCKQGAAMLELINTTFKLEKVRKNGEGQEKEKS